MSTWLINPIHVVLLGRVNVGKSTLFNKITEKAQGEAVISRIPGTTRDVNQGLVSWREKDFTVIDTGGWQEKPTDKLMKLVSDESVNWMKKGDLNVLVLDATSDPLPEDKALARIIKKHKAPYLLAINKVDSKSSSASLGDWYKLGLGEPLLISATQGRGVGTLLDNIIKKIPTKTNIGLTPITVGIIGKPNVGKSSIINAIAGQEKMLVSAEPHTTRESHPVHIKALHRDWLIVDTAGWRKKRKQKEPMEKTGTKLSWQTALNANVNWLVIDISQSISAQDKTLGRQLTDSHRGLIIAANKWDLAKTKTDKTQHELAARLKANFNTLKWAEVVFVSAHTKYGIKNILKKTLELVQKQNEYVDRTKLEMWWQTFKKYHPATRPDNPKRKINFRGFTQIDVNPHTFMLTLGVKDNIPAAWLNLMENQLRIHFKLTGLPLIIKLKHVRV